MKARILKKTVVMQLLMAACLLCLFAVQSCKREPSDDVNGNKSGNSPTPYSLKIPKDFPPMDIPVDNPFTVEGVSLGRQLFYEKALSGDNSMACAGCHGQDLSFSDAPKQFSKGIDGMEGSKNSMVTVNMGWNHDFFWDGRAKNLEAQILQPVPNPVEMHLDWKVAVGKLQSMSGYPEKFKAAFGTDKIDSMLVAKAVAQFLRTIIVTDAKAQKVLVNKPPTAQFTPEEARGYQVFLREDKGDCFHCHVITTGLFTDNYSNDPATRMHNNGLDPEPPAGTFTGRGNVTKNAADNGKFKAPTLLNIELTGPYMHDGRFKTLEEVINFYDTGVYLSSTLDPNMNLKPVATNRIFVDGKRKLSLTQQEKSDLLAFLKTLTDNSILTKPEYAKP